MIFFFFFFFIFFFFFFFFFEIITCNPSRGQEFDPDPSNTFVEIDHEIIPTAILLPSADLRGVVISYKRKYVHEVLVNRLVKLAQE